MKMPLVFKTADMLPAAMTHMSTVMQCAESYERQPSNIRAGLKPFTPNSVGFHSA